MIFQGLNGAVAQLGERRLCKPEVVGSNPSGSTNSAEARWRRARLTLDNRDKFVRRIFRRSIQLNHIVKKGFA